MQKLGKISIFPKWKKSEWLVLACFLIFLGGEVHITYFSSDPLTATETELFRDWVLRLIRSIALTITISSVIIIKIRAIRREGYSRRRLITPLFGVGFCIFMVAMTLLSYRMASNFRKDMSHFEEKFFQEQRAWIEASDLSPEDRSKLSRMNARFSYMLTGKADDYISQGGGPKPYEPTQEEQKEARQHSRVMKMMDHAIESMKVGMIVWSAIAIFSIMIGIFSPLGKQASVKKHDSVT
jgi:hypothetical protein